MEDTSNYYIVSELFRGGELIKRLEKMRVLSEH